MILQCKKCKYKLTNRSYDNNKFASGGEDAFAAIVDVTTGKLIRKLVGHT